MSTSTPAAATPAAIELHWPRTTASKKSRATLAQWAAIGVASLIGIDPVVNSFVLPDAQKSLGMSPSMFALASSLATLILTAGLLGAGALADRIGRRRIMIYGLWITLAGEVITLLAPSSPVYILGRFVVGIGMAGAFGMSIAVIPAVTAPAKLASVYGRMFACSAAGALVAIVGTGILVSVGGWRAGFSINVILVAAFLLFAMYAIPESKASVLRKFDTAGVLLAGIGLLLVMYGLGEAATKSWGNPAVLGPIAIGLITLVAFVMVERRIAAPSFPMKILTNRAVVAAIIAVVAAGFAQGAMQANVVQLVQGPAGYSASTTSILALPFVIFGVIGALTTGAMVTRGVSVRLVLTACVGSLAIGVLFACFVNPANLLVVVPLGFVFLGLGLNSSYGVGSTVIMRTAPPDMLGSVGTVKPVMGQLGYGLGLGAVVPFIATFTDAAKSGGADTKSASFTGFERGMYVVFALEVIALIAVILIMKSASKQLHEGKATLPPMTPEREAAILEAKGEAELP